MRLCLLLFLRQLFMMHVCVCVCVCVCECVCVCVCVCVRVSVCVVVIVHWHCLVQLSMFNMEKCYRNKIIIIIIIMNSVVPCYFQGKWSKSGQLPVVEESCSAQRFG